MPWRGRPNPPPLNWNTPDNPVIRKVSGGFMGWDDDEPRAPQRPPSQPIAQLLPLGLPNRHWLGIVRALALYGDTFANQTWDSWWDAVKRKILEAVNLNTRETEECIVKLSLQDWQQMLKALEKICEQQGPRATPWLRWIRYQMKKQLKF